MIMINKLERILKEVVMAQCKALTGKAEKN
jgi:hypothetical protein